MKNILLVFGLLFLLFSCETESQKPFLKKIKEKIKYHKLSIVVDSLPNDIGFYTPFLLFNGFEYEKRHNEVFDTITKKTTYEWDSLITGDYVFKTLSYKEEIFSLSISKDTTIKIKSNLKFKQIDKFDKKSLLDADTIEIIYVKSGCKYHYVEKSILIKDKTDNSYFVSAHFNNGKSMQQKKASSNVIEDLFSAQNEILKVSNFVYSTSTEMFQLSINGRIYSNRNLHKNGHIYADFKKKYITIE